MHSPKVEVAALELVPVCSPRKKLTASTTNPSKMEWTEEFLEKYTVE